MHLVALYALVVLFSAVWSSAFVVGKIATAHIDPYSLLALRHGLAAALLLPWMMAAAPGWRRRSLIRAAVPLGLLNNGLYLGLTFTALGMVPPAVVIVIVSCAPFLTTLLAVALRHDRFDAVTLGGIALGFCGVLAIVSGQPLGGAAPAGIALAAAGTVAFCLATLWYRRGAGTFPPAQVNFWQSLTGAVAMAPLALALAGGGIPAVLPADLVVCVLYLATVVSVGGMALWMGLIRISGPAAATSYHLLNPFFAVLFSHLAFGTTITLGDIGGVVLIGAGLLVVARRSRRPA